MNDTKFKLLNDPVHGHIPVDKFSLQFIDTSEFQRLRDLKQLGCCYFVFPGASHNRFEHCIGVGYLAGKLLERFKENQPELEISPKELKLIKIAGLCHDLGHGPFSHIWDGEFLPRARPGLDWKHEQGSVMMLDYLIDQNSIDIDTSDIKFIKDIILSSSDSFKPKKRSFLYDIVANGRNSIDVDKFDYLARDCLNLGIKSSYDFSRLMNFSKVICDEICFHSKETFSVYEMFHTRYSLFKQVYSHRVGKAIEYMITDALLKADNFLQISNSIDSPEAYTTMTDSILRTIEISKNKELEASRKIISDLRKRRLYKFVARALIPAELAKNFKPITEMDIISLQKATYNLKPEDIIIHNLNLDYAMKDKNPVDNVHFFSNWNDTDYFSIPKQNVSLLIPELFQEKYIQIFCRESTPAKMAIIREVFTDFAKQRNLVIDNFTAKG